MGKVETKDDPSTDEKTEKATKVHLKNRASRNKSEKDRRDKLNDFISELATMVPDCSSPSRKLDKATILKNTVDFMKVHNDLTVAVTGKDTSSFLTSNELGQLMLEGSYAFLFVISLSGTLTFISESVHELLGYATGELLQKNIFEYVNTDDKVVLMKQLVKNGKTGAGRSLNAGSSSFFLRLKRKSEDAESQSYETLHCVGRLRTFKQEAHQEMEIASDEPDDDSVKIPVNESCFVVLAEVVSPNHRRDVSNWVEGVVEYKSRQSLDGKFLYLDPRCIPITGYLPYEILGSVMYEFIHCDDLESIAKSFESLIELGEGKTGNYRILTKGRQWIVIQTTSYISYNHWNSKPEFICSTHQLVKNPGKLNSNSTKEGTDSNVQVHQISSALEPAPSSSWNMENRKDAQSVEVSFGPSSHTSSSLFTKDQSSQQDIGEGPNVKPSFESSTANSPRPPYHVNPDSTIQTLPTSLLPTASVAKMVQGCDEISQSFAKQDFGSITQRTSVSNERFQSSRITCDEGVERLYVSPKEAVQRLPFPTVKSPEVRTISPTQIKDQLPGAVRDGSIRSNVKIGERSPLSPNTIHVSSTYTSTSAAQESVLLPGKVFERFSRSSGGTSDGSSTSPSQLCRTSPLSPTTTSERFSRSPEKNPESSPMLPCTSVERFPQSAADITAGSPLQHARMIDRHSHSPAGIPEKSPVPPKMTERFPQCLVGINEISVKPPSIVVERFSGSSAGMSASYSIQRPRITNRFSPPAMGITEAPSILSPREVDKFPHAVVRTQPPTIGIHEGSPQKPIGMVDKYPPSSTGVHGGSPMPSKNSPTQIPEGSRQPPTRMLDKFSHSSVGIYNGFSLSPERMIDRCSQSSVGISEGSPQPPSIMVNRYPQSPLEIHEGSPRPPTTGMLEQYTQSPVRLPEESLQPTSRMVERYPQSSFATFESPPQSCVGKRDGSSFTQRLPCNSPISHVGETEPCSNAPVTTRSGQGVSQCSYSSVMGQSSMYGVGNAQLSVPRPLDSETSHLGQTVQNNSYQRNVLNELSSNYSKNICRMPSDQRNLANIHGQSIESNFLIATSRRDNTRDVMQVIPSRHDSSSSNRESTLMPSDEIGGFNDAQKILQEQLVEKQNYLQTVIQNQKKQLTQIQRQICLNAQAQFSLHEVKDLEMSKQLQRQAQILELERKQQEARQRELKSLVVQKINPTTAHTSDTKIIQDYCQSSDLSLSRASYSNIATSGQDQRTSLSTPSSISDGFVGRHECVTYNTQPITPAEYVTTRSIVSYTKTAESSASGATGVDYVPTTCDQRVCSSLSREGIQPSTSSQNVLPKTLVDDTSKQLSLKQLNSASVNSTITGTITHTVDSLTQRTSVSTSGSKDYFSKFSSEKLETFLCTSSLPPTTTSSSAQQTHVTTSGTKDYFSKFSSSELETFLSTTSLPPTTPSSSSGESSSNGGTEKGEQSAPSSYDTLLLQQKQLLEMQEVQRRQLLLRQQEQLLRIRRQQEEEMLLLQLEQRQQSSLNSQQRDQQPCTSSPPTSQAQDPENRNLQSLNSGSTSREPELDTTYELTEEDQYVVNMLLAESDDFTLWSGDLCDDPTPAR